MFSFHWPFSTFARGDWVLTRPQTSLFLRTERDQREREGWWEGGTSLVNEELKQRQRRRQRERQKDFSQPSTIWFLTFGLWVVKRATQLFSFAAMLQNKLHVFAARFTLLYGFCRTVLGTMPLLLFSINGLLCLKLGPVVRLDTTPTLWYSQKQDGHINRPFYRYGGRTELITFTVVLWDTQGAWALSDIFAQNLLPLFGPIFLCVFLEKDCNGKKR